MEPSHKHADQPKSFIKVQVLWCVVNVATRLNNLLYPMLRDEEGLYAQMDLHISFYIIILCFFSPAFFY